MYVCTIDTIDYTIDYYTCKTKKKSNIAMFGAGILYIAMLVHVYILYIIAEI